jgi:hypothetical protein
MGFVKEPRRIQLTRHELHEIAAGDGLAAGSGREGLALETKSPP